MQRKRGARATSSAASGESGHRALLWKEAGTVGSRATARRGPKAAVGRSAGLQPAAIFAGWAPASHGCGCGSWGVLGRGSAAFVSVPQGEAEQQRKKIGSAANSVLLGGGKGTVLQASRCCGNGFLEGREVRVWVIFVVNAVRSRENATRAAPDAASSGAGGRRPPSAVGMRGQMCRRAAATRVPWGAGRGSSPWLAARLPVLWPSLPGAAREIL